MALTSSAPEGVTPSLAQHLLVGASGSLQAQSMPNRQPRNGIDRPYHLEDYSPMLAHGNEHGWGLVGYTRKQPVFVQKSNLPAHQDDLFQKTVSQLVARHPETILAHIRQASPTCNEIVCTNNHPFVQGDWSFMHNGYVPAGKENRLISGQLARSPFKPIGTTDSETAFGYFLHRLQKTQGSVDTRKVGPEKVQQVFAETLRDLILASKPAYRDLQGKLLNIDGSLEVAPSMNFVLTDGRVLLAFRRGAKLYVGKHENGSPGGEFVLSSEPVRYDDRLGGHRLTWLEIPNETLFSVTMSKAGKPLKPVLTPLTRLAPMTGWQGLRAQVSLYLRALWSWFIG